MPSPRFETLAGIIDGVNLVFTLPTLYVAGTTSVFVNSSPVEALTWTESNPATGEITFEPLVYTPQPGDLLQAYYMTNDLPEVSITEIDGTLTATDTLSGTIEDVAELDGVLEEIP